MYITTATRSNAWVCLKTSPASFHQMTQRPFLFSKSIAYVCAVKRGHYRKLSRKGCVMSITKYKLSDTLNLETWFMFWLTTVLYCESIGQRQATLGIYNSGKVWFPLFSSVAFRRCLMNLCPQLILTFRKCELRWHRSLMYIWYEWFHWAVILPVYSGWLQWNFGARNPHTKNHLSQLFNIKVCWFIGWVEFVQSVE